MPEDPLSPEDCLRSLAAEALRWAPYGPLFPESMGLMAVANAFVMLGLLPEPRAEAVLADHKSALERMGLGNAWGVMKGELTVRPGAHEYCLSTGSTGSHRRTRLGRIKVGENRHKLLPPLARMDNLRTHACRMTLSQKAHQYPP